MDSRYGRVVGGQTQFSINRQLDIFGLELLTANIPFSWYNVTAARANVLSWTSGAAHSVTVPDGFYDSYYFCKAVQDIMQATDGFTYSVTVSDVTGLTTIEETGKNNFDLNVAAGDVLSTYAGFDPTATYTGSYTYTGSTLFYSEPEAFIGIKITNADVGWGVLETNIDDFDVARPYQNQFGTTGVLMTMANIDVNFGAVIRYTPPMTKAIQFGAPLADMIVMDCYRSDGTVIGFNGVPWSVKFKMYYENDRQS